MKKKFIAEFVADTEHGTTFTFRLALELEYSEEYGDVWAMLKAVMPAHTLLDYEDAA